LSQQCTVVKKNVLRRVGLLVKRAIIVFFENAGYAITGFLEMKISAFRKSRYQNLGLITGSEGAITSRHLRRIFEKVRREFSDDSWMVRSEMGERSIANLGW
jgi:hypothetical protein